VIRLEVGPDRLTKSPWLACSAQRGGPISHPSRIIPNFPHCDQEDKKTRKTTFLPTTIETFHTPSVQCTPTSPINNPGPVTNPNRYGGTEHPPSHFPCSRTSYTFLARNHRTKKQSGTGWRIPSTHFFFFRLFFRKIKNLPYSSTGNIHAR